MKKRVFDLGLWVSDRLESVGLDYVKNSLLCKGFWGYGAHGKTRGEHPSLYFQTEELFKDVYVSKFNVGDKFRVVKLDKSNEEFGLDYKILNVGDVGVVREIDEYDNSVMGEDGFYYHEDDLEPYTKTKVSMNEIAEKFDCKVEDLEIVKE